MRVAGLLEVRNLKVDVDSRTILNDMSLSIPEQGLTLGVVGESGSGKTTLASSILNALEPPMRITRGSVEYSGKEVLSMSPSELRSYRWAEVAMVPQAAMNSLNPVKRILNPIVEVARQHKALPKSEAAESAHELLTRVGIPRWRHNEYPHELSGGMKQRVMIALALALSPKILIADEPTSALDVIVQEQLISLLRQEVKERNLALIYVTHEISILSELVENLQVIYRGECVERGPLNKILAEPLHPYSKTLLSSTLTMSSTLDQVKQIPREGARNPEPSKRDSCPYTSRCKYAFERCNVEKPKLTEVQKERWVACHLYS